MTRLAGVAALAGFLGLAASQAFAECRLFVSQTQTRAAPALATNQTGYMDRNPFNLTWYMDGNPVLSDSGRLAGSGLRILASQTVPDGRINYMKSPTTGLRTMSCTVNAQGAVEKVVVTSVNGNGYIAFHRTSGSNTRAAEYSGDITYTIYPLGGRAAKVKVSFQNPRIKDPETIPNNFRGISFETTFTSGFEITTTPPAFYARVGWADLARGSTYDEPGDNLVRAPQNELDRSAGGDVIPIAVGVKGTVTGSFVITASSPSAREQRFRFQREAGAASPSSTARLDVALSGSTREVTIFASALSWSDLYQSDRLELTHAGLTIHVPITAFRFVAGEPADPLNPESRRPEIEFLEPDPDSRYDFDGDDRAFKYVQPRPATMRVQSRIAVQPRDIPYSDFCDTSGYGTRYSVGFIQNVDGAASSIHVVRSKPVAAPGDEGQDAPPKLVFDFLKRSPRNYFDFARNGIRKGVPPNDLTRGGFVLDDSGSRPAPFPCGNGTLAARDTPAIESGASTQPLPLLQPYTHGAYYNQLDSFDLCTGFMLWAVVHDAGMGSPTSEPARTEGRLILVSQLEWALNVERPDLGGPQVFPGPPHEPDTYPVYCSADADQTQDACTPANNVETSCGIRSSLGVPEPLMPPGPGQPEVSTVPPGDAGVGKAGECPSTLRPAPEGAPFSLRCLPRWNPN
jgi:hypothetical protein